MTDSNVSSTSKVGYRPNIQQPVGKVTLSLGDFKTPNTVDRVSDDDAAKIQEFLEAYTDTRQNLDDLDKKLEDFLSTPQRIGDNGLPEVFAIPYDPAQYPDLDEAHHHICGRPGATNVIIFQDIKQRLATEKSQVAKTIGLPTSLDEMNNMDGATTQAKISGGIAKAIAQMLDAVWRQIIVWVLEFFYATVAPLASVPIVKAVPRLIKRAIAKIKGTKNAGPNNFDSVLGDANVDDQGNVGAEQLAKAGGGYIASIKEVAQELPPECLIHTANWNRIVESIVRDGPYASAYYAKKVSAGMLDRMDSLNKMAAVGIPEGHVFTARGTTLTYTNPLPEEYLKARADGSTRFGAISDGLTASVKEVQSTIVPRMEKLVRDLVADPNLLCCLIRNISLIANTQKMRKILLYIQALLQFWRNLHILDISKEIARLGNMIVDLVNRVLQSIFSLYISFFNSQLSKFAVKIKDLEKFKHISQNCRPWNELLNLGVDILTEMLEKISSYLSGFFLQFRLDIATSAQSLDELSKISAIDKYLDLINKILRFSAAWAACVESKQDPRVILSKGSRLTSGPVGIILAPSTATNIVGSLSPVTPLPPSANSATSGVNGNTGAGQNGFTDSGAFSSDGLQVLMTNFLGISNDKARQVLTTKDDCACDNSLTPQELNEIEQFVQERS